MQELMNGKNNQKIKLENINNFTSLLNFFCHSKLLNIISCLENVISKPINYMCKILIFVTCVLSYSPILAQQNINNQKNNQLNNPINDISITFLSNLIGKNIASDEAQKLLNYCNNKEKLTGIKYSYFCPLQGLQIEITNEIIDKITLYDTNTTELYQGEEIRFVRFSEKLFKNVNFGDSRVVVITKLGKSAKASDNIITYREGKIEFSIVFKKTIEKIIISANRCISGNCKEGFGVYQSRNGDHYEGNWKNSVRHGKGTNTFSNGDIYKGNWLHDLQDGQGTMTYKNGAASKVGVWERGTFKGEMSLQKDPLFNLLGKHKTDGTIKLVLEKYGKGYKVIQLLHDHQEYRFNNGKLNFFFDEYGFLQKVDVLKNGIFDFLPSMSSFLKPGADQKHILHLFGEPTEKKEITDNDHKHYYWIYHDSIHKQIFYFNGKHIFQSFHLSLDSPTIVLKTKISGQCLKGDCNNGYGEILSIVGKYRGYFKNNFFTGKGRLSFASGCYYSGRFKDNLRHGYGVCQWTDQSSYKGQWRNNVFHGYGIFIDTNKDHYEGSFNKGKRHGYGKMRYSDGTIYFGNWKDNLRNGEGIFQQKNGRKKRGMWKNDEMK